MFRKTLRGILPISLAVIVAVLLPFSSLAETASVNSNTATDATTQATAPNAQDGNGMENTPSEGGKGMGNSPAQAGNAPAMTDYTVDTSNLTDEQNTIYTQAVTLYEQVEDEVLSDLVTAGVVAQADVDTYTALRAAQKTLTDIDKTAWTAQQYKAYYEANAKTGDDRKTAMQALADSGLITQAQADALASENESSLWSTISKNAETNSEIQTALSTMRQAAQTMSETLKNAGINIAVNGNGPANGMNDGMGKQEGNNGGFGGGQNNNRNTNNATPAQDTSTVSQ